MPASAEPSKELHPPVQIAPARAIPDASFDAAGVDEHDEDDAEIVHLEDAEPEALAADVDDDVDEPPPYRPPTPAKVQPRGYKFGTRKTEPSSATGVGAPPWWASTDPKVWEEHRPAVIARGSRIKTPGQNNIICMSGAF